MNEDEMKAVLIYLVRKAGGGISFPLDELWDVMLDESLSLETMREEGFVPMVHLRTVTNEVVSGEMAEGNHLEIGPPDAEG